MEELRRIEINLAWLERREGYKVSRALVGIAERFSERLGPLLGPDAAWLRGPLPCDPQPAPN